MASLLSLSACEDAENAPVARAFVAACEAELQAPKPGNVHIFAPGHGMEARDFVLSANAAAPYIAAPGANVGARILSAVEATWAAVGQNTNLGIVLLCAPLAHAALTAKTTDLRAETARVLAALDRSDADLAFRAIAMAKPAGLGAAPQHDVTAPAQTTLREAMRAAAHRDSIARQYANDFMEVFDVGVSALHQARKAGQSPERATLSIYVAFLLTLHDSHLARKWGGAVAEWLRDEEGPLFAARLDAAATEAEAFTMTLGFDRLLKARGYNPGTSADLTVATLFADSLTAILARAHKNG